MKKTTEKDDLRWWKLHLFNRATWTINSPPVNKMYDGTHKQPKAFRKRSHDGSKAARWLKNLFAKNK